jgi:hypothetical protein
MNPTTTTMPRSTPPPAPALLLFASTALAVGTYIASIALGFLWTSWQAGAGAGGLTGVFFAPFCVLALLVPLGTGPLALRWFAASAAGENGTGGIAMFVWLFAGAEVLLAVLMSLGAPPGPSAFLPHAVLAAYALRAALTLTRNPRDAELPPAVDPAP